MTATLEDFSYDGDNPYITALVGSFRFNPSTPITFYLQPGDADENGIDDWVQHDAGDGIRAAFEAWSRVANVQFQEVFTAEEANFVERYVPDGTNLGGIANHGTTGGNYLIGLNDQDYDPLPGGEDFATFVHEIGHGLGLGHPHEAPVFPGVEGNGQFDFGDNDLNNKAYTVMSYRDHRDILGTVVNYSGQYTGQFGYIGSAMSIDIAAIQAIYGPNMSTATGDDIYDLPETDEIGTYWSSIWDAGGTDTIRNAGSKDSYIDLRPATLLNQADGGGFFSRVGKIVGGFTIANGVEIENAIGGSGNDVIVGNALGNAIDGGAGDDTITGGLGADLLTGGTGADLFRFVTAADSTALSRDLITDFEVGADVIDATILGIRTASVSASGGVTVLSLDTIMGAVQIGVTGVWTANQLLPTILNPIEGTSGVDPISGTSAADAILALAGNDTVQAGAGNDVIVGGAGDDQLYGQDGDDVIYGDSGGDRVEGSDNDFIYGGAGADRIYGGLGADMIDGGSGSNIIEGGEGDDVVVWGGGFDTASGGTGEDTYRFVYMGNSPVIMSSRNPAQTSTAMGFFSITGFERFEITGGNNNDQLLLSLGQRAGWLDGGAGNDNLYLGTNEADIGHGGTGDDTIVSPWGKASLYGDEGNDRLITNSSGSGDLLVGGTGDDYFEIAGTPTIVELAGEGTDTVELGVYYNSNLLFQLPDNIEKLILNQTATIGPVAGNDLDNIIIGNSASNSIDGGAGADWMYGGLGDDSYVVDGQGDLVFEFASEGYDSVTSTASFYLYAEIEKLTLAAGSGDIFGVGNELDNLMMGNEGQNLIIGWDGADEIHGGAARDALFGVEGNDRLYGDAGIDYIVAGAGDDLIDGGADADEIYGQEGDDTITGGATFDTDIIVGGEGNDIIYGNSGLGDYDWLYGNEGDDTFYVDTPDDLVFEQPGEGHDVVYAGIEGAGFYLYADIEDLILTGDTPFGVGNELDNSLTGSDAPNWLLGGAGNDTLNGKGGNDVLFGESGADTFVFEPGTGGDVIGDFAPGTDRIDLSAYGLDWSTLQTLMFEVDGTTGITPLEGDLLVLNGVGLATLHEGDFVLI